MKDSGELEMAWWRRCVDVSFLQFNEGECDEEEIMLEGQSSLQSGDSAV